MDKRREKIRFKSADGLSLEGETLHPTGLIRGIVVLTHPHPLYGGTMENNVVASLWVTLPEAGFLTFRFNFRGVGASEGTFEEGRGETYDLSGAVQLLGHAGGRNVPCFLIGYSFGAFVIHQWCPPAGLIAGIVLISPPVSMRTFELERFAPCPTLIATGDQDPFCRLDPLKEIVSRLDREVSLKIFPGIDHFWLGQEEKLAGTVRSWLEAQLRVVS